MFNEPKPESSLAINFAAASPFEKGPIILLSNPANLPKIGDLGVCSILNGLVVGIPTEMSAPLGRYSLGEGLPGFGVGQILVESINLAVQESTLLATNVSKAYQFDPVSKLNLTHNGTLVVKFDIEKEFHAFGAAAMEFTVHDGQDPLWERYFQVDLLREQNGVRLELELCNAFGVLQIKHATFADSFVTELKISGEKASGELKTDLLANLGQALNLSDLARNCVHTFSQDLCPVSIRQYLSMIAPNFEGALLNSLPLDKGRQLEKYFGLFE